MYWMVGWPVKNPTKIINANRLTELASVDFEMSLGDNTESVVEELALA